MLCAIIAAIHEVSGLAFLNIAVAGRFYRSQLTTFKADYAHQLVRPEVEHHFGDADFLMIATVYMPGDMQMACSCGPGYDVRANNIAKLPGRDRVAAKRDDQGLMHSLQHQSMATSQRPRRFAAKEHKA